MSKAVAYVGSRRVDVVAYVATVVATILAAALALEPWQIPAGSVFGGGDQIWVQASVGIASQAGPFGVDQHLGWPTGQSLWSYPQFGVFLGTLCWLVGQIVVNNWAVAAYYALIVTAGVNAAACLFLIRSSIGRRLTVAACAAALVLGATPFILGAVGHLNVAAWFVVPIVIGVLIRSGDKSRRWRIVAFSLTTLAAMASPLWWLIVAIFLVVPLGLIAILRRSWARVLNTAWVAGGLAVAFVIQYLLFISAPHIGATYRRPWESNTTGGHLTDFLLASPFLNNTFTTLDKLVAGSSRELKPIGFVVGVAAIAAVVLVVSGLPRRITQLNGKTFNAAVMADATVVALLLFLAGGLGNLQAGFAVLLGQVSPARAWSRMSIVLGMLGVVWLLILLARYLERRVAVRGPEVKRFRTESWISVGLSCVILGTWFLDIGTPQYRPNLPGPSTLPEASAVSFITSNLAPCPIAQLPKTDVFNRSAYRSPDNRRESAFYRSYVPFFLAPNFYWSYGDVSPGRRTTLDKLPTAIRPLDAQLLASKGYCAILFDKLNATTAGQQGISLTASDPAALGAPDFSSDRYNVYVLSGFGSPMSQR